MLKWNGFTLVEVLVSMFIIVLMSGIIFANYRQSGQQFALQRSASKLAQDIRRVQQMAMGAKEFGGSIPPGGYGIYFDISAPTQYILFADTNSDYQYSGAGERIEDPIEFEKGAEIQSLNPSSPLNITFTPPDPKVRVNTLEGSLATINLIADTTTKTITVNAAGLIEIQ